MTSTSLPTSPAEKLRDTIIAAVSRTTSVTTSEIMCPRGARAAHARYLAMSLTGSIFGDHELADLFKTTMRTVRQGRSQVANTPELHALAVELLSDPTTIDLRGQVAIELGWDDDIADA